MSESDRYFPRTPEPPDEDAYVIDVDRDGVPLGGPVLDPTEELRKREIAFKEKRLPKAPRRFVKDAALLERRLQIFELRRRGMNYDQIAKVTGLSRSRVRNLVLKEVRFLNKKLQEETSAAKRMELERLDAVQEALWAKVEKGDSRAAEVVLKVMDQRAKLLGLNEPEKSVVTHDIRVAEMTPAELVEEARKLGMTVPAALLKEVEAEVRDVPLLPPETAGTTGTYENLGDEHGRSVDAGEGSGAGLGNC